MQYSQEVLEEMSQKVDLLDYASKTVDFVRHSGNIYYAICPFHNEKTASLAIDSEEKFFKCYGCGRWGSIYNWIQWTEGLTFNEAVQKVADITNTDFEECIESETVAFYKMLKRLNQPSERQHADRTLLDIDKDYYKKFKDEIPQEWVDEGISPDIMRKYEIRIDTRSNRIVYPVYDSNFKMIGVKGRTRFKDYKALKIMKYMNYNKIGILDYFTGAKQADPFIKEKNEVIIVEGIKSVMKLAGWGYNNAVSAETSALNEYQIELLIRMRVKNVVIAFDKDVPFKKIKKCSEMLSKFTNVWVVNDRWRLLDEKDSPPDKGLSVWETLYERKMRI